MNTFASFIVKETKHILRDSRTMMILFGIPMVMMLLFGFAISTDVRNVRTVAVLSSTDNLTQRIIQQLDASEYFTVTHRVATPAEAEQLIRNQQADMAVVFAPNVANRRYDGTAKVQLIADAADPNMAIQRTSYAERIIAGALVGSSMQPSVNLRMLYNPQMKSTYNFVPGIMGLLLMIICAMMTSVSIVREKERGTMEVLLVSPVRPVMIILAKAVPYLVLSVIILVMILLLSVYLLGVPVAGSLFWIFALSLLYIFLSLALGLLISILVRTQVAAMLVSGVVFLLPNLLLSGMIFPVESMPEILQYMTAAIPGRWYIAAMRKLMIMGVDVGSVRQELTILSAMTAGLLLIALGKFNKRLDV